MTALKKLKRQLRDAKLENKLQKAYRESMRREGQTKENPANNDCLDQRKDKWRELNWYRRHNV
jgi:hypothetical protein